MHFVVDAQRAYLQRTSPWALRKLAQWHADIAAFGLGKAKRPQQASVLYGKSLPTSRQITGHQWIAARLREVAVEVEHLIASKGAF